MDGGEFLRQPTFQKQKSEIRLKDGVLRSNQHDRPTPDEDIILQTRDLYTVAALVLNGRSILRISSQLRSISLVIGSTGLEPQAVCPNAALRNEVWI